MNIEKFCTFLKTQFNARFALHCLKKIIFPLSIFFLLNSCEDSGCIEADDFGEYQSKTLKVYASASSSLCKFNRLIDVGSPNQPALIKQCISSESCANKGTPNEKNKCAVTCETDCLNNPKKHKTYFDNAQITIPADRSPSEPRYVSVGSEDFRIFDNSKILISAFGNISLGQKNNDQIIFSKDDFGDLINNDIIHKDKLFMVDSNDELILKISAKIGIDVNRTDPQNFTQYFSDPTYTATEDIYKNNELKFKHSQIANGSKRLFGYFIESPDRSIYPEDVRYLPILPEPKHAFCKVTENTNITSMECSHDDVSYPDKYSDAVALPASVSISEKKEFDKKLSEYFSIDNNKDQKNKFNDSGFLLKYNEKPYPLNKPIPPTNTSNSIKNITQEFQTEQILVTQAPNQYKDYEVRLVYTPKSGSNCQNFYNDPTKLPKYKILNYSDQNPVDTSSFSTMQKPDAGEDTNFTTQNKYTFKSIRIKNLQKLYLKKIENIKDPDDDFIADNCDYELHFYEYKEVDNLISGFSKIGVVKNLILPSGNSYITDKNSNIIIGLDSCSMNVDIRNADGTYEFDGNKPYSINETEENGIYLRKGQVLLIKPDAWNSNYIIRGSDEQGTLIDSQQITCGVGFYIRKTPKPAVLCHQQKKQSVNVNEDWLSDNNCSSLLIVNDVIQGCSFDYSECDDYKKLNRTTKILEINNKFCPSSLCLPTEDQYKSSDCKPTYDISTNTFRPASNCPDFTAITNYASQLDPPINGQEVIKTNFNKIHIKCDTAANCGTSNNCKDFSSIISSNSNYLTEYNTLSPTDKLSYFTFEKCKTCLTSGISSLKKVFAPNESVDLDQCYDLENYKGSMNDFYNKSSSTKDRMEIKELKDKGLNYLSPFLNLYGNFYSLKSTDENFNFDVIGNRKVYESKGGINSSQNGYIKFTLISNPHDLNNVSGNSSTGSLSNYNVKLINSLFFNLQRLNSDPSNNIYRNLNYIEDNSKLRVTSVSKSEFKNGQQLEIRPCTDNGSVCSSYLIPADNPHQLFPKIIHYTDSTPSNQNKFKFNEYGKIERISNPSENESAFDCSPENIGSVGSNFLCLNFNQGSNELNRISFKIIDNETPNCKKSNGDDCSTVANDCNGVKKINIKWDGKTTGNCPDTEESCDKKYYCVDKYFNNTGHYNVNVRVLNPEKTKFAKLANSIISPVLEEIDGYKIDSDENVESLAGVENFNKNYNGVNSISNDVEFNPTWGAYNTANDPNVIVWKYFRFESDNLNINIPMEDDNKCKTSKGCVIAYIAGFFGSINPATKKIDTNQCFFSNPNLRQILRNNCHKKMSCNFIINEQFIGSQTLNANNEIVATPTRCNNPLHIYIGYKKASKDIYKESQAARIYKRITSFKVFQTTLTLSMVLMITFYGLGFMMGVTEMKQSDIMDRLVKIGLIYLFTSPIYGWIFFEKFFVTFFKGGTDYLTFLMASIFADDNLINNALNTGNLSDKTPLFSSVDKVLGLYLINDVVHKKISALLFYNFVGIIYCVILYYCAISYIYAASNAILLYLTAQFFTSILFVIGPFFFIFILFKQTKGFFDNWLNSLIGFSLQQIFVIFTLNIFNMLIYMVTKMALGFRICWDNIWYINSFGFTMSLFSFWTIQDAPPYINETSNVSVHGEHKTTSPSLTMIILTWSMVTIMRSFLDTISDLAAQLSGGIQASALGANISQGASQALAKASALGNKVFDKVGGNQMISRLDKAAFDSGALAKKARKDKKQQNKNDRKDIKEMRKAGEDAVKEYKMNNAAEFAKMSESDKKKTLMEIKKDAMINHADGKGKSQKDIDRLMNKKGFKGNGGSNIFGGGLNMIRSGGTARTSLNDSISSVDTGYSKDEIKGAMKNMDEDQRKDFMNNLKSGEIQKKGKSNRLDPRTNPTADARNTAIKQLEESGKIAKKSNIANSSTIQAGLKMAGLESKRSDKDEKLIQEQMQKNAISSATDKGSNFSKDEINKYEKLAKYQDAKDIGDKDAMKEARKEFKEADKAVKSGKGKNDIFSDSKIDADRLNKIKENNNIKMAENKEKQGEIGGKINQIQDSIKGNATHNEMDNLNNKIKSGDASDEEKSKFNKMVIEDNKNSRNNGESSYQQKDMARSNLQESLSDLKVEESNIEKRQNNNNKK